MIHRSIQYSKGTVIQFLSLLQRYNLIISKFWDVSGLKIICLTPVKNEGWILERFLKCTSLWADYIIIADQSSVQLFKNTFQRLRPCHNEAISNLVHIVNNKCGGLYGFVSSHATNTFAFAVFTSLFFSKKYISLLLIFWALVVSYSRIYLGVHYPLDVIGGGILGLTIGILVFKIYLFTFNKVNLKSGSDSPK